MPSWILWVLGAITSAVGGCFGFSMLRISQVEAALRDEMRGEFDSMRTEDQASLAAIGRTHDAIWAEMRRMNQQSEEHRNRVQDRIGQLPTRDEMKADLAAMERRIQNMFQVPGSRH